MGRALPCATKSPAGSDHTCVTSRRRGQAGSLLAPAHRMDTTNELELSVDVEVPEVEPADAVVVPAEIAALAAQLRAGRCVLCAGPRLALGGIGLREMVAQLLGELPDAEAHEAWPLLESRPLLAAGFVRRRLGEGFFHSLALGVGHGILGFSRHKK